MGLLDGIGKVASAVNPISSIITAATPIVNSLLDLIPSENKAARQQLEQLQVLLASAEKADESQREINKEEAQHQSTFVAGWRPFIGWVLGVSIAFYFIPKAVLTAYFWTVASIHANEVLPYPLMDSGLWELITALLGMSSIRTADKALTRFLDRR